MGVRIFYALVVGFVIGIFVRSLYPFGWVSISAILSGAMCVFALTFSNRVRREHALVAAIAVCAIAGGAARAHVSVVTGDPALSVWLSEKVTLEGVVVDEPDQRENNVRIPVRVTSVASTTIERDARVLVIAPLHTTVAYGDRIRASGTLRLPEAFDAAGGRTFNYPGYLAKDGIGYELSFARVEVIGSVSRNPLKVFAIALKRMYLDGLGSALPEPQAGLAGGITAGDKRGLGKELSETFRIVGLVHIVVLSGYNIMIVIAFFEKILARFAFWIRGSLALVVAALFALMTGLASSSVRAASMAGISVVGTMTKRTYLAERALALVAFGMLMWNPFLLVFDPGFQLSVLATFGLIYLTSILARYLTWMTEKWGLREIASATLGTQAAVLPLLLYQNGTLSLYSLPANLLALIVVPYAMLFSVIAGIAGATLGALAPIIGFPAYLLLSYITLVANIFASLPLSSLAVPAFSFVYVIIAYVFVIAVAYRFTLEKGKPDH